MSQFRGPGSLRSALAAVRWIPSLLRALVSLRGCRLGRRVKLMNGGRLVVRGATHITIGDSCHFRGGAVHTELACGPDATIVIGHRTGFNFGVSLRAKHSIRIGEGCMFGALVIIRDHDGMRTSPVVIGDRVWLAHAAVIEPGVTIGDEAVISAGSVVVGDVPPRTLAVGNPARCVPLPSLRRMSGQTAVAASPE